MTADDLFRRAADLFDRRQFVGTAEFAWLGLRRWPDDGRLLQLYGTASCNLNDHPAARAALEHASALVPLCPPAQLALARCYAALGQRDLALTIYEHLATAGLCPTALLPAVAADLGRLGEDEIALRACRALTDRDPTHHQALFGTAYYLARLGADPRTILAPLALAMDLAPHVAQYRLNVAFVLADAGRADEAADVLREIALASLRCPCLLRRARAVFERAGDADSALACDRLLDDRG